MRVFICVQFFIFVAILDSVGGPLLRKSMRPTFLYDDRRNLVYFNWDNKRTVTIPNQHHQDDALNVYDNLDPCDGDKIKNDQGMVSVVQGGQILHHQPANDGEGVCYELQDNDLVLHPNEEPKSKYWKGFYIHPHIDTHALPPTAEELTLAELFPGSEGVRLPPLEVIRDPESFDRLYANIVLRFNGENRPPTPIHRNSFIVMRNRIIIGVLGHTVIRPVTSPDGAPDSVYDPDNNRWVKLKPFEMHRLGLDQYLQNIQSRDCTFAASLPNIDDAAYATQAADVEAAYEGSLHADKIMQAQRSQIAQGINPVNLPTHEEAYQEGYDRAYMPAYRRAHNRQLRFLLKRS